MRAAAFALLLALAAAAPARAHEERTFSGKVVRVSGGAVLVRTPQGRNVRIPLGANVAVLAGARPAAVKDLRPGLPVHVWINGDDPADLETSTVQIQIAPAGK